MVVRSNLFAACLVLIAVFTSAPGLSLAQGYTLPSEYDFDCVFERTLADAYSLEELPEPVRDAFLDQLSWNDDQQRAVFREYFPDRPWPLGMGPDTPVIAERGQDVAVGTTTRRFIRGGGDSQYWFIWYENHGVALFIENVLLELDGDSARFIAKVSGEENLCRQTERLIEEPESRVLTGFW